jgi:hypothetical protein
MSRTEIAFSLLGAGLFFTLLAPIMLFVAWPYMGPVGMLLSFVIGYGCILAAIPYSVG